MQGIAWSYNRSQLRGRDTKCLSGMNQQEHLQYTSAHVVCSFAYCWFRQKLEDAAKN